jgi:hypothetical protein
MRVAGLRAPAKPKQTVAVAVTELQERVRLEAQRTLGWWRLPRDALRRQTAQWLVRVTILAALAETGSVMPLTAVTAHAERVRPALRSMPRAEQLTDKLPRLQVVDGRALPAPVQVVLLLPVELPEQIRAVGQLRHGLRR